MPNYSIWMLGASQISVTLAGGAPGSLSGITQGDGSHLLGGTIVLNSANWEETFLRDGGDSEFDDNDGNQRLRGSQTIDGVTYANNTTVEAEYTLVVEDPDGNQYTVLGYNVVNSSPGYATIEGLAFVGGAGGFPPRDVPLTVVDTVEGPGSSGQPPIDGGDIAFPICFTPGTRIQTPDGWRPIETIAPGDLVLTRDAGPQPVAWAGRSTVTAGRMARDPRFRPVRIREGAFGPGRPDRDMLVSPQHRFAMSGWRAEILFAAPEVLVPAIHLVNDDTIMVDATAAEVTYIHLMFDRHHLIWADGLETESFYPGAAALGALEDGVRAELFALFPELRARTAPPAELVRPALRRWESGAMAGYAPSAASTAGSASGRSSAIRPGPTRRAHST